MRIMALEYNTVRTNFHLGPRNRHVCPARRVPWRSAFLFHGPTPPISGQPSTGHQHSAPAVPVVETIQRSHETTPIWGIVVLEIELGLLHRVRLQVEQHDAGLCILEPGLVDRAQ